MQRNEELIQQTGGTLSIMESQDAHVHAVI